MKYKILLGFFLISVCQLTPYAKHSDPTVSCKSGKKNTKPLRILFVVGTFPWYTKIVIMNQITGMIDRGHDVYIYAEHRPQKHTPIPEVAAYDLLNKTYYGDLPSDLNTYDVIVCQYGDLAQKYIQLKDQYHLKAKFVTFFRGADITSTSKTRHHAYDELFAKGDLFLPICGYFQYRLNLLGCNPKKAFVQYSGVDCSKFTYKKRTLPTRNEKISIVSVGRLVTKKALSFMIDAFVKLERKYRNVEYIIVGDGPERSNLEEQIKRRKMSKKIKLVGWKSQEEIVKILHNAHIFVLPSATSQGGNQDAPINVLKEAMLTGLPVVSTFHGGIIELVDDGVNGFLVPERDTESLVKKIGYLIDHPEEWAKMGNIGRKKVIKYFDMEKLNNRFEKLLLALVHENMSNLS